MKSLHIETIAIGDEILTGKISDTNSTYVADQLFKKGLRLTRQTIVADNISEIKNAITEASHRSQFTVVFGGLGPTSDDKTAETVADLLKARLVEHEPSKVQLLEFLNSRNRQVSPESLKQVLYPECTAVLFNSVGLAPGFHFQFNNSHFFFMPGVPQEMKPMFLSGVLPEILKQSDSLSFMHHTWKCLEIPEAELQRKMNVIERNLLPNAWLGYRTKYPENHLSLYFKTNEKKSTYFDSVIIEIREILKPWTYTESDIELEEMVIQKLKERKLSIALAESCTGGLVMQRLSRVPGASEVLWGGVVSYKREAKEKIFGLHFQNDAEMVSEKCTRELTEEMKKKSGASVVATITGYMGPTGGTDSDPVGTVYIAVGQDKIEVEKMQLFIKSRESGQWAASSYLLRMIYKSLALKA